MEGWVGKRKEEKEKEGPKEARQNKD